MLNCCGSFSFYFNFGSQVENHRVALDAGQLPAARVLNFRSGQELRVRVWVGLFANSMLDNDFPQVHLISLVVITIILARFLGKISLTLFSGIEIIIQRAYLITQTTISVDRRKSRRSDLNFQELFPPIPNRKRVGGGISGRANKKSFCFHRWELEEGWSLLKKWP